MKTLIQKLGLSLIHYADLDIDIKNLYPLGSAVVVNDQRFMSYDPDLNNLAEVIDHLNYQPLSDGYFGVTVSHTHIAIEFKTVLGELRHVAVPVTSVRPPNLVEGLLNKYENRSIGFGRSLLTRSVRKILEHTHGFNTKFYNLDVPDIEDTSRQPTDPDDAEYESELDKFETRELGAEKEFARESSPEESKAIADLIDKNRPLKESKPLLDWDADEDGLADKDAPKVEPVIAPVIETEPEPTPVVQPVVSAPKSNENFVPATKEELLLRAQRNIGMIDREAGIEELDGAAGRVAVDAKRMILCRADLNQLVPFKYEWAWQAYLKATEHHWMPLEINLDSDVEQWKDCTADESKLISFALYSLEINGLFKTNDSLLALYRSITNPEARQYILRQRFELTVWGNFVNNAIDNFNYQFPVEQVMNERTGKVVNNCDRYSFNDANYLSYFKRDHIQAKQKSRHAIERFVGDPTFKPTNTFEDRLAIVTRILARYICFGFIYNFTSILQLSMLGTTGKFNGLSQGGLLLLRDLALHTSFGVLVVQNIFAENPDLLQSEEAVSQLRTMILEHANLEIDYMDWWANSDLPNAKSADQIQTLQFMINRMTVDLGLGVVFEDAGSVAKIPAFVSHYDNFVPNLHGGGASVVGSGGALSW